MTKAQVRGFIEALANHNPAPETELSFADPFTLLVAVVLSAQATDLSVNKATASLFRVAPTPKAMIDLGVDGVASHIRSIGLWQTKARNVVALSRALEEQHGGEVPGDRAALEALPGVGPQDRERGAERRLRGEHHGGRYPHLPGGQSHRPGAGKDAAGGGGWVAQADPA